MKKKFEIVKYDPIWRTKFQREKERLEEVFKDNIFSIHHIGSTAIPNTKAKAEIDILLVVKTDSNISRFDFAIEKLGYKVRGECLENGGTPGRFYYSKDIKNIRTHKLHVCKIGHEEILKKLIFVKYLKDHSEEAENYASLKIDLAKEYNYGRNFEKYLSGKSNFIVKILEKAFKKYNGLKYEDFL